MPFQTTYRLKYIGEDTYAQILEFSSYLTSIYADQAALTLEQYIANMFASGMTKEAIQEALLNDLHNGGPIFGSFKNAFSRSVEATTNYTQASVKSEIIPNELPEDTLYLWTLDPTIDNHCDTCLDRSEMDAMTWGEWESIGLPGSGVTLCNIHCYCSLEESK